MDKLTTLIVDDNRDFAESMGSLLKLHNHRVDIAFSGEEAVYKTKEKDFNIIFMDINLPGRNGLEAFLDIRKFKPDAKVVMMSGYGQEELLNTSLDNGAWGILKKPFKMEDIFKLVNNITSENLLLIADDDMDFVESLRDIVEGSGYSVMAANNGRETVELARSYGIDLLLLDLRLPDLSGLEVYSELIRTGTYVPTIIITSYIKEEEKTIDAFRSMPIEMILSKPFDPIKLRNIINDIFKKKKGQTHNKHKKRGTSLTGTDRRLMIVEKDRDFAESILEILNSHNYTAELAYNANEALRIIHESDIRVVLIDIGMKYYGGINLISELHNIKTGIVCVIMTADVSSEDTIEAVLKGVYNYIKKPFNIRELLLVLDHCFEKVHLEIEKYSIEKILTFRNQEINRINDGIEKVACTLQNARTFKPNFDLLEIFSRNLNAEGGSLFLKEMSRLTLIQSLDPSHVPAVIPFPLKKGSILEHVIKVKYSLLIQDIKQDSRLTSSGWNGYRDNSSLIFPLFDNQGEIAYIITLHSKKSKSFIPLDRQLGLILSYSFSKHIDNNKIKDNIARRNLSVHGSASLELMLRKFSHELRQPISSIVLYVATMQSIVKKKKTVNTGFILGSLNKILRQLDKITDMIDKQKK